MPSFDSNIGLEPMNSMTAFFDAQRAGDAHIAQQQQNQLARQTLGSNTQISANTAESGSLANQLSTQKNPLEIIQLRQQLGLDGSPALDGLTKLISGGQPPIAAPDSTAPTGGDGISGNPLLGPLPGYDLAGRPLLPANGSAPASGAGTADATQMPGPDHPALPAVRDFATKLMALPSEQRPAAYQMMLPAMRQAGAIHAPDQYPGDDAVSHLASGAPLPVQVAGPGAPTGGAAAAPDPSQPPPGYLPPALTPGPADDVIARLRAAQPDQNGLAPLMSPDGNPPPAPVNTLTGPAPQAGPQPSFMPAASAQPPTAPPATGMNSPQVQQALALQQKVADIEMYAARYPNNPQVQKTAAAAVEQLKANAALIVKPPVITAHRDGSMTFTDPYTGAILKQVPPADLDILQHGDPASPDYAAAYQRASAAKVGDNGQIVQPDMRAYRPPAGATPGAAGGGTPPPGSPTVNRSGSVDAKDYERDAKEIAGIADSGQAAQSDQIRIQAMRDALAKMQTGSGGASRAQYQAFMETWFPDRVKAFTDSIAGIPDASVAQEFSKLALKGAGTQERGVLGARGGYQAMKLFQSANPSLDLRPNANQAILGMQLIGTQADADYANAAQSFFNQSRDKYRAPDGSYEPLSKFDAGWQQQRNPQVYAAAMGALAGQPVQQWAKGLSDQEYARAMNVVSRADPSATVNGKSGRLSMQPSNTPATPAVGAVMQGHRFLGGDPSSPTSWQPVQ